MAKFISVPVTAAASLESGIRLFNADSIITVNQTAATTTTIILNGGSSVTDIYTLTHTSTTALYGTTPVVKNAINAALIAVPGGQNVLVGLPAGIDVTAIAVA